MAVAKKKIKKKLVKKPRKKVTPKVEDVIVEEPEPVMEVEDVATDEEEMEFLKKAQSDKIKEEEEEEEEEKIEEPKPIVEETKPVSKSKTKIIETPDIKVAETAFKDGQKVIATMSEVDGLPVKVYKIYPKD